MASLKPIVLGTALALSLAGCGKSEEPKRESFERISTVDVDNLRIRDWNDDKIADTIGPTDGTSFNYFVSSEFSEKGYTSVWGVMSPELQSSASEALKVNNKLKYQIAKDRYDHFHGDKK